MAEIFKLSLDELDTLREIIERTFNRPAKSKEDVIAAYQEIMEIPSKRLREAVIYHLGHASAFADMSGYDVKAYL